MNGGTANRAPIVIIIRMALNARAFLFHRSSYLLAHNAKRVAGLVRRRNGLLKGNVIEDLF